MSGRLQQEVAAVRRAGHLPLVLAGDSAAAPGMVAGAHARRLLWLGEAAPGLTALLGQTHPGLVRDPLADGDVAVGGAGPDWLRQGPLAVYVDLATGEDVGARLAAARSAGTVAAVGVAGYDPVADAGGGRLAAALAELGRGLA